ncbi:hypothetical protein ACE1B6_13295 [Aerosakkonemataceae cyanobacterium BLCC-F154]|uniref:Uncharacterized protein n=1 Tax=Floridaenema fluviatile BLCC-F154 TaxID=3153640 RepID=A0ABV4YBW4_9CYAN
MSDQADPVYYALNVNFFAFTLQSGTDLDSSTAINEPPQNFKDKYEKLLKNNYDQIFDFDRNPFPEFRQKFPDSNKYELLNAKKSGKQSFSFSSQEKNQNPLNPKPLYRLLLYPQKISDSYALLINIFRPEDPGFDTVNLNEIPLFNPNKCLTLADDKNFIGQTFFITAYLSIAKPDKPEKLRSHAEKLLKQLLGDTYPDFYEADEFLDGYILEFSRPRSLQTRVLVLFYFSNTTSEQLRKIYFDLPELFLYYHKITHVFQMSRQYYQKLDDLIQSQITSKSQLPDSLDLELLKTNLKELLKTAPQYTLQFRTLENAGNTISIHRQNYQRTWQRLQGEVNNDLAVFDRFLQRESQIFELQIQADLNYSKPGAQLLDQAIASIRGLVEIEQAERDRTLQNTIQSVGFGIGVAGVVASSAPYLIPQEPRSVNTFFLVVFLCLLAGLTVWGIMNWKNLITRISSISNQKNQATLPTSQNQPVQMISSQKEPQQK